ncbi:CDP-glycerol glycerophosphotransferase family protein [Paraoerskovia marina]|uniref:CDP-glycerol glycerophosphotransferase family protein n=1 Tax=Paraoerskovia marina TaxID=545619 RepID=UPI001560A1FE|nr:CDP-glycerol glycerophosphotransferase family protein [Paraoerskovia marina]
MAYLAGGPSLRYQVDQWIPVLETLDHEHKVLVVVRTPELAGALRTGTRLPVACATTLEDLLAVYAAVDTKVILYPNNGSLNFQSLIYREALHVHVNHGESDKSSMASNQAKAYDAVIVAGAVAEDRYCNALLDFSGASLIRCGRPQLDVPRSPSLDPHPSRRTVLYAPTWSGEEDSNNCTSVDVYGPQIIRQLLHDSRWRVVYKPHPRVVDGDRPAVHTAHREILDQLDAAQRTDPDAQHRFVPRADVLSLFGVTDLLITDVSSVGLDFLYLRPEVPILLTDRRSNRAALVTSSPLATGTGVLDAATVSDTAELVAHHLAHDPFAPERSTLRDRYFGIEPGESTTRFLEVIGAQVRRRDELVRARENRQRM